MHSDDWPVYERQVYAPATLGRMADLLERAGGRQIDAALLQEQLLHALGLAAYDPSHAVMADGFERAAKAEDPLDPAVLGADLGPELSARIRWRWKARWKRGNRNLEPSLSSIDWDTLNTEERDEIRGMLRDLAAYHRSFVRRGRVRKHSLDTALHELASIYLDHTGLQVAEHELPYSINSQFIKFCVLALRPFGDNFEVSPQALSRRWERRITEMRGGLPDQDVEED